MNGLFHVWTYRDSGKSCIFYQPNGLWYWLKKETKCQKYVRLYLVSLFCPLTSVMILLMILVCVCVEEICLTKWKDIWLEINAKPPLQPRMSRKLFETLRFFRILGAKICEPSRLYAQKISNIRNISKALWGIMTSRAKNCRHEISSDRPAQKRKWMGFSICSRIPPL